jgi:hypothetical protein
MRLCSACACVFDVIQGCAWLAEDTIDSRGSNSLADGADSWHGVTVLVAAIGS